MAIVHCSEVTTISIVVIYVWVILDETFLKLQHTSFSIIVVNGIALNDGSVYIQSHHCMRMQIVAF